MSGTHLPLRRTPFRATAVLLALAGTLTALAGCSGNSGSAAPVPVEQMAVEQVAAAKSRYVTFPEGVPAEGWTLERAVKQKGEGRKAQQDLAPNRDWFAEYSGPGANLAEKPYLLVSGFTRSLAEHKADRTTKGAVRTGTVAGHPAYWGKDPDAPQPVFLAFRLAGGYTVELAGSGVTVRQLRTWAALLQEADEAAWKSGGGVVVDCLPDEDCPGVDPS